MVDASKCGACTPKSDAIMCLKSIRVTTCISIYGKNKVVILYIEQKVTYKGQRWQDHRKLGFLYSQHSKTCMQSCIRGIHEIKVAMS